MRDSPVVCLLGPRQSGKSALVRRFDPTRAYYTFDDPALLNTASEDPSGFLAGLPPAVTLDEIQRVPSLLPVIKVAVDRDRSAGRFLLTGSANLLLLPSASESLAGRMEIVRLYPLTEAEKERRSGRFLERLLGGSFQPSIRPGEPDPEDLVRRLVQGGYPEVLRRPAGRLRQWHRNYIDALIQKDASDVTNLRSVDDLAKLLRILSLQTAQLLNVNSLSKLLGIHRNTVENQLFALERLFLVRRLSAWHPNDARRLVKAPKVHVVDSGLAATLADASADDWIESRDRIGHLLESFVVQELIAQAGWTDPGLRLWHYRDKDKVEVDVVITRGRQTWGVEVKASATVTSNDGQGLRRLADKCGDRFKGGILLHSGVSTLPLGDPRLVAVPLSELWTL